MEMQPIRGNSCSEISFECDSNKIEDFIKAQIQKKGLDERTEKAYRLDLEHMYLWLGKQGKGVSEEKAIERYLEYLLKEKRLKVSTITRKYRVISYYLEYLAAERILLNCPPVVCPVSQKNQEKTDHILSKAEIDAFLIALHQEYENLDNEFRRRICLRDSVMMELLFYHGIEISELLRLEMFDYNRNTGILEIRGKREKKRQEYLYSRDLREKLERWIEEHSYFERDNEYHNIMFLSKIGKPLSMKMVILVFDKYRELAGIEKEATPKDLKCSMERYARELMIERCT